MAIYLSLNEMHVIGLRTVVHRWHNGRALKRLPATPIY
jgi:hypothetical protein